MSERTHHRRPATFKLDEASVVVVDPDHTGRPARGSVQVTPESEPSMLPVTVEAPVVPVTRGFRWGALFAIAIAGLAALGLGVAVTHLIEDLFARSEGLGFVGLAFTFAAAVAFVVVVAREAFGLIRLATKRKPRRGARSPEDCAPESPFGARPRRVAGPCRRHHRRCRHDPPCRARIDDAARCRSAAPGLARRATRLDRHRGQPARLD